jgi:hypothetical protein
MDCGVGDPSGRFDGQNVFEIADIAQIILALKQTYEYIRHREATKMKGSKMDSLFSEPERLP